MNAPEPFATQAELARQLGVSRQAINELVKRGKLALQSDGKIDVALARMLLTSRLDPGRSKILAESINTPPPTPPEQPDEATGTSFHVAKALREMAEAKIAQIRLRQLKAELVDAEAVRTAIANIAAAIVTTLDRIPDKLAPRLAAETDEAKIHAMIKSEISQAKQALSGETV